VQKGAWWSVEPGLTGLLPKLDVCGSVCVVWRCMFVCARVPLQNFWDEVFPTPKRSGREHRGRDDDRHDGADARRDEARAGKEVEGKSGVGRARREEEEREDDVRSLGLPSGREEAVKISRAHRTSSAASRHNLDDYFG